MRLQKKSSLLLILICGLAISSPAYAYLDPGSGSVLLQGLLAGTAGVIAIIKLYWQRLKDKLIRIKNKNSPNITNSSVDKNSAYSSSIDKTNDHSSS